MWLGGRGRTAKFILYGETSKDNAQTKKLRNNDTSMLNGNTETNNKGPGRNRRRGCRGWQFILTDFVEQFDF